MVLLDVTNLVPNFVLIKVIGFENNCYKIGNICIFTYIHNFPLY